MSDEVERPSEETLIESWLHKWGEEKLTKAGVPYAFIDFAQYREALSSLLNSFIKHGYSESDVRSSGLLRKIQEAMTPAEHDTHKLKDWRNIIAEIWKWYVAKKFVNESLIEEATTYPKNTPKPKLVTSDNTEYVAPVHKLDPSKFEGFGPAQIVDDEEWVKLLEKMKNE